MARKRFGMPNLVFLINFTLVLMVHGVLENYQALLVGQK